MRGAAIYLALAAGAAVMAYPFLWMLGTGFKTLPEALATPLNPLPETWQWGNLPRTFERAPFARYFFNSIVVSAASALAVVGTSLLAGYAFARINFRGRAAVFGLLLATMMVPFEVTFIPNFVTISRLGWYNTYAALIVPWCASAFGIFLVRQAFLAAPQELFEAATVDGCGHLRFLYHIGAGIARPALTALFLFSFLSSYNALLWPLVVTGDTEMRVVQVGLAAFVLDSGVRLNLLMCASTVVIMPAIVLYLATQRYFHDHALQAGLKG